MVDVGRELRKIGRDLPIPEPAFERLLSRRDRKRRTKRVAATITAFVVTLALTGTAIAMIWSASPGHRVDPASGLDQRLVLDPGEYLYTLITSSEAVDGHIRHEETWWALDGSGEVRNDSTRQDKYPDPPTGVYGPGEFPSYASDVIADLSTDPAILADQLEDPETRMALGGAAGPEPWRVVRNLLLRQSDVTPTLRIALFEVATQLPGVERLEDVADPLGRISTALTFTDGAYRFSFYFDPSTAQPMAVGSVYRGNELAWEAVSAGIVPNPGLVPQGEQWLVPPPEPA